MKAISVKADGTITEVEVDPENFPEFQSFINDDFPNIVRRGPIELLGTGTVMVVGDTGQLRGLPLNRMGTVLYGGNAIVGDVLIIGEFLIPEEGADFCDLPDPENALAVLRRISRALT